MRLFVVAMLGALISALVVFRTRWRQVAVALAAAFVLAGGSELLAYATFQPSAFTQPQFSGSLVLAHQLLGPVERATGRLQDFTDELSRIVGGAARVYGSIGELPGPRPARSAFCTSPTSTSPRWAWTSRASWRGRSTWTS